MLYFFNSTNKSDRMKHPLTVSTSSIKRAYALAIINFRNNNYKGSPIRINI